MPKLFDYVTSINTSKVDLMKDDKDANVYNAFYINRSLSYFADTVGLANVVNQYHHLDKKLQYHFLINIIRKRKRFSKWHKASSSKDIDLLKNAYGYNNARAEEALNILNKDQLSILKDRMNQGGKQ